MPADASLHDDGERPAVECTIQDLTPFGKCTIQDLTPQRFKT